MARRPPHLARCNYVGSHRIFVTMCTFGRREHFGSDEIVETVRTQLLHTADTQAIELIAYCFMPDHLHALATGITGDADIQRFMTRFRQRSGHWHRQSRHERLWQEGYFERHLRGEEATFDVVSYIVSNPVRARLCRSAHEYRYCGSSRYKLSEIVDAVQWRPHTLG